MKKLFAAALLGACCLSTLVPQLRADDWPQWMGLGRDGLWKEEGIVTSIPDGGLPVKFRAKVGLGYAGPAVAEGRVFVPDYIKSAGELNNRPSARDELEGDERLVCLDASTGKELWTYSYPCKYKLSYAGGPRVTPTVDGDRVYGLGAEGRLYCLDTSSGDEIWARELKEDYEIEAPIWGFCGHPLVDGDQLICLVGGKDSLLVSFDKRTGKQLWASLNAPEPGYCPPSIIEAGGVRQLLIWHPQAVVSVDPKNGEQYWSIDLAPGYGMSINAPQKSGDLLYASGIGNAAATIRLDADKPAAEVEWRGKGNTGVYCSNSTPLIYQGVIYGVDCRKGMLRAVDLGSGERLWETTDPVTAEGGGGHGTAFLVRNGSHFYLFNELGELVIATLDREGVNELGRQKLLEPTQEAFGRPVVWTHPAFANRHMFVRNDEELVCVSLAGDE